MVKFSDGGYTIGTVDAIAEEIGVSPKFLYLLSNNIPAKYKIYKIPKSNGKFRTIEAPEEGLKFVQRMILDRILPRNVSKIATAFELGKGLLDNAKPHVGRAVLLELDLKDFFPSFRYERVCGYFEGLGYPRNSAVLLTELCTLNGHLPQGAPTSPHLANLMLENFDKELAHLCKRMHLKVTRYADDITISGMIDPMKIDLLIATIRKSLSTLGLRLNWRKIRVLRRNARQEVTGVVVNERPTVSRETRRQLRLTMYYLRHYGLIGHEPVTRHGLEQLLGKIEFVNYVDPENFEFNEYAAILRRRLRECS